VWRFAADHGVIPVAVAVDEHGLEADRLERAQVQAVLLTPAHQFPLGGVLPPDRRQQVLAWARHHRAFVIEDDYDAEYRYNRQPIGALQGLSPDRVIYIGSASKILAPALRLGWLAAPPSLLPALIYHKRFADFGSPLLEQLAYAEFLRDGGLDRHLRRMRIVYRRRRDALISALARHLPAWRPVGEAAGLHLVTTLPPGLTEQLVVQKAAARSIRVYPMRDYSQRRLKTSALVFGYGFLTEEHIERGIVELAKALSKD
jgi:GntR family transcriptional regulator/MocR family aminotransferase